MAAEVIIENAIAFRRPIRSVSKPPENCASIAPTPYPVIARPASRHRETVLREVQREEREDEAPEPEHERAREQDPRRARERAEAVAEPWTPLDG